jgi:AraC-like DNA-binding protein/mannose-6-phosphate isomerase-like protein (cupin superfamily)
MKAESLTQKKQSILHPLESLGVVTASRGDIRAEKLEDRLQPKVPFPHKHDFFQLLFLFRGKGSHEIDFVKHAVKAGDIYIIKPGQVHTWTLDKSTRGCIIEFYLESLQLNSLEQDIFYSLYESADVLRGFSELPSFEALCDQMRGEFRDQKTGHQSVLKSLLNVMMISLYRLEERGRKPSERRQNSAKRGNSFIRELESLIEANFTKHHGVEFYAQILKVSPKALTMRVLRLLEKSARDLIQERCLLEARRYLGYSNLSIAEISERLGFEDANYFTRLFRMKTGMTPGNFRQQKRGK